MQFCEAQVMVIRLVRHIVTGGVFIALCVSALDVEVAQASGCRNWVEFADGSAAGGRPVAGVLSSGLDSIVITLVVPGALVSERTGGGVDYSVAEIPGEGWLRVPGKPMVPQVVLIVACPEFDDIRVQTQVGSETSMGDVLLYPSPREAAIANATEDFCIDEGAYALDEMYPAARAEVLGIGRIRDQKVVWLGVYPVRYNPLQRKLEAAGEVTVTLSYSNPRPTMASTGTGPFEDICRNLLLGYEAAGVAGWTGLLSTGEGQVVWASNLQDCIDNNTDYLMVAAGRFCSGADSVVLQRLADFRADSCGFNVSIVNVASIGTTDTTLKAFIKDLYDSRSAAHWWDGHLGFVALVGDFKGAAGDTLTLIPRHLIHTSHSDWQELSIPEYYASDNWYACVTEDSYHPALMLGRISVDTGEELANVVNKTLAYEPLPDGPDWSTRVFLTAGTPDPRFPADTLYVTRAFGLIESAVEGDGLEVSTLRGDKMGPPFPNLTAMNADSLASGRYFVNYLIHGDPLKMGYQRPRSFEVCSVETLANYGRLCVFTHFGCQTARFDTDSLRVNPCSTMYDCVGERFLNTDNIGAVAYIGQTDAGDYGQIANMDVDFYEAAFGEHDPVLGMAFAEMLMKQVVSSDYNNRMALLGVTCPQ